MMARTKMPPKPGSNSTAASSAATSSAFGSAASTDDLIRHAAALGCLLSIDQPKTLPADVGLIAQWNQVYNLTAIRNPADMVVQHLLDCVAVVSPLRRQLQQSPGRILDAGSGAGLPGIVLAIAAPEFHVTCVDAVAKKAAFMVQAQAELKVPNLVAQHARMEQLQLPPFDVITSRALGSLNDLVQQTRQLLKPTGIWMAMKGVVPTDELDQVRSANAADVFHVEQLHISSLQAERCLVWMRPAVS